MEFIAAHWASYLSCCSSSIRTARSRNSGGYLISLLIAPSSQGLEPPTKPGRFKVPMSRKEMMNTLGLRGRDNFEKLYLRPALSEGYIEYTLPDKPNSRLQQYRLTEKGRAALASSKPN